MLKKPAKNVATETSRNRRHIFLYFSKIFEYFSPHYRRLFGFLLCPCLLWLQLFYNTISCLSKSGLSHSQILVKVSSRCRPSVVPLWFGTGYQCMINRPLGHERLDLLSGLPHLSVLSIQGAPLSVCLIGFSGFISIMGFYSRAWVHFSHYAFN